MSTHQSTAAGGGATLDEAPLSAAAPGRSKWWVLALCGLGQLMVVLDLTVVNIALPKAQLDLGFSNDDRQWIVTAYALAFGGLLLLGGRLADRLGRRTTFIVGMTGFAIASAVGGASQSFAMLATARAVQGVFAALLAPATLSLLTVTFTEPGERGKAFGIFSAIAGSGSAIGLILGGALTTYLSWNWCLYVNDVIAVAGLIGAVVVLRKGGRNEQVHIDDPGIVVGILGVVALVFGFSEAATQGWGSVAALGPIVASPLLLAAFVAIERRARHPFLPMKVLLDRNRGTAYLTILLVAISMFAVFLFLTYYLEEIAGYSAVRAGCAFLPMMVFVISGSILTNVRLLPRFGPRWLVPGGAVLGGAGMLYLAQLSTSTSYLAVILPSEAIFGLGLGCLFGACFNMATSGATEETAGVASALVTTGQQVGGSIGTSLLNTIATSSAATYLATHATKAFLATHAKTLATTRVYALSQVHSYQVSFYIAAGMVLATAVVAFALFPRERPDPGPELAVAAG